MKLPGDTDDIVRLLERIVNQAVKLLSCDAASIFLLHGDELVLKARSGRPTTIESPVSYKLGEGLTGWVQQHGRALRVDNVADFSSDAQRLAAVYPGINWVNTFRYDEAESSRKTAGSLIAAPIVSNEEAIGVIRCVRSIDYPEKFTQEEAHLLEVFAETAATAIEARRELNFMVEAPFAFVLMPFASEFSDIYEFGIKETMIQKGVRCERVDEMEFNDRILDQVYKSIQRADLILADMTGRNPNVYYEVGYAHALKKDVILLTQDATDIPFDLKHHNHIEYGGKIAELRKRLGNRVQAWLREREGQQ
jgi:hypothetical protein